MEILSKLYLELAATLPPSVKSRRELALEQQRDKLAVSMLLIANGAAEPQQVAADAIERLETAKAARPQ